MTRKRDGLPSAALDEVRDTIAPGGRVVRVRPLPGGISSSVHLVHLESPEGLRQAVVVRRYGEYWQRTDPQACEREFKLLDLLARLGLPVPKPLLLDADGGPYGAPTVVMTRLPGKPVIAPRDLADYLDQMAQALAALHALPIDDFGFLRNQRVNVERTLADSNAPGDDPLQYAVFSRARELWPAVSRRSHVRTLVHGDFWPGNLLWLRGRLVGIVDWEQPRVGDSAKDVATCRGDLSILFGLDAADAFVERYRAAGGVHVDEFRFWDLLIAVWAVREIDEWATVYPVLGRPELTPTIARRRIREFAERALTTSSERGTIRR